MLLCTVRDCGAPLMREGQRLVCANSHSFDVARSGYVNLLQPQDRRSHAPGDSKAMVAARRRLHESGATAPLLEAIAAQISVSAADFVLDAGCGDGFYLGSLAARTGCGGYGVDISRPAVEAAARRRPDLGWIVANADRFLPFPAGAFSRVMSITARRNPPEFRRVLADEGRLLVAVPAPDDLAEIRGAGRDRAARTVAEFAPWFRLEAQSRVRTKVELDAEQAGDIRLTVYRPLQAEPPRRMQVTFSLDLLDLRPTGPPPR